MNLIRLSSTPLLCLLGAGLTTACVTDKDLGDLADGTDSGTTEDADPGSSTSGTASASTSGTSVDPSATTGDPTVPTATVTTANPTSPTATVTTADPSAGTDETTDTETDTEGDTEGASICADWAAPPQDCEGPGNAVLQADWDAGGPAAENVMCTVAALTDLGGGGEQVTLSCGGDAYSLSITTDSPHVPLPLAVAMDVRFSIADVRSNVINTPSFEIRSLADDLLVAYVNEVELEPSFIPNPIVIEAATFGSGCPGVSVAEKCSGDGSILEQRLPLLFAVEDGEPIQLFDRAFAVLEPEAGNYSITVGQASHLVCWDDDCIGDDSGPFDRLEFLIIGG